MSLKSMDMRSDLNCSSVALDHGMRGKLGDMSWNDGNGNDDDLMPSLSLSS